MKAVIIYNTKTGNTKELAEKMKSVLERHGHQCDIFRDKEIKKTPEIVEKYDMLAIGAPMHAWRVARFPFQGVVKNIAKLRVQGKKLVCFSTTGDEKNWRKVCAWISEKLAAMDHIGDIGCVERHNEEAIASFEKLIRKL